MYNNVILFETLHFNAGYNMLVKTEINGKEIILLHMYLAPSEELHHNTGHLHQESQVYMSQLSCYIPPWLEHARRMYPQLGWLLYLIPIALTTVTH